jgi:hypothetical protein
VTRARRELRDVDARAAASDGTSATPASPMAHVWWAAPLDQRRSGDADVSFDNPAAR